MVISLSYTRTHSSVENSEIPLVLSLNGDIDGRMGFSPLLCVFIPLFWKMFRFCCWDLLPQSLMSSHGLGICSEGHRDSPEWAGFLCGFFSTSYSSYPMDSCFHRTRASSAGTFCCQLHAHGCEGDPAIKTPSKLVYTTVSTIPRKNDCQLLKADFNTKPFSKKKKKIIFFGWLVVFSLSKGGSSKIICYILPSMVKGSTQCSCTLLVLSETISIPTFYLTSHLSSASHTVV